MILAMFHYLHTLRTLIFARHLFSRVHIFAAYIFAPEALGINFRYVSIFAWWLFSFFSPENPLEVIFAPVYMLINIVRNLTCWHAYILNGRHYFHVLLFSRVVIFAFFLGAKITTARKLMSLRYQNLNLPLFAIFLLDLDIVLESFHLKTGSSIKQISNLMILW